MPFNKVRGKFLIKFYHNTCRLFINTNSFSVECKAKETVDHAYALVYRHQDNSTKSLKERTHDIHRLKMTLERTIKAQMDEISSLAEQRNRMMRAMSVLELPESIGMTIWHCQIIIKPY